MIYSEAVVETKDIIKDIVGLTFRDELESLAELLRVCLLVDQQTTSYAYYERSLRGIAWLGIYSDDLLKLAGVTWQTLANGRETSLSDIC